jgi:predicted transcriptional regulator
MARRVITQEILQEVKMLAPDYSAQQIAEKLGLKVQTLYSHLYENNIVCKTYYKQTGRFRRGRKRVGEGMFDVDEIENWLA